MSEELKELESCPFCKTKPEMFGAEVACPHCRASTKARNRNAAITMWNNGFIYAPGEELPYRLFWALERLS